MCAQESSYVILCQFLVVQAEILPWVSEGSKFIAHDILLVAHFRVVIAHYEYPSTPNYVFA